MFDAELKDKMMKSTNRRHLSQFSMNILPCSSAILLRCTPDRRCNPSIFWVTMYLMWPESSNAFNAIWHFVGMASENEMFTCGDLPSFSSVHTPFGPLEIVINIFQMIFKHYICKRFECKLPKIRYACWGWNTGSSVNNNMFGCQNHLSECCTFFLNAIFIVKHLRIEYILHYCVSMWRIIVKSKILPLEFPKHLYCRIQIIHSRSHTTFWNFFKFFSLKILLVLMNSNENSVKRMKTVCKQYE